MEKKIVQVQERTQQLIRQLLNVWESSVRATHDFLSEEEIIKIREYVPMAIENVEYLTVIGWKCSSFLRRSEEKGLESSCFSTVLKLITFRNSP